MPSQELQILNAAIARNCALVLSLPSAGMLRHYKSRFLSENAEGIWVESPPSEHPLIGELINTQQPIGIAFRNGPNKILFTVPVKRLDQKLQVNAETQVEAVLIALPVDIKTIQRRSHYRVQVFADAEVTARAWRIPEHAHLSDRPLASTELKVEMRDISLGGLGVTLRNREGGDPKVIAGQRLRIELKVAEVSLILDGRVRQASTPESVNGLRTGIALKPLDSQLEGRQKLAQLARIVGDLQREEVRRVRRSAG